MCGKGKYNVLILHNYYQPSVLTLDSEFYRLYFTHHIEKQYLYILELHLFRY